MTERLHVASVRLYWPRVVCVRLPTSVAAHASTDWSKCWPFRWEASDWERQPTIATAFVARHVLHASHIALAPLILHSGGLRKAMHGGAPVGGQA
jgi:hypothetical protein